MYQIKTSDPFLLDGWLQRQDGWHQQWFPGSVKEFQAVGNSGPMKILGETRQCDG
jgi:hypothetical protein